MPQLTADIALQLLVSHGSSRKAAAASGYSVTALLRAVKKFRLPDGSLPPQTIEVQSVSHSSEEAVLPEVVAPQVADVTEEAVAPQAVEGGNALEKLASELGVPLETVSRAWLKSKDYTLEVAGKGPAAVELSPGFVELLDSARRHVLRVSECKSADSMLVISLCDAHIGKLAYRKEAGENYDASIASTIYRQAVSDALAFFNPSRIKKVVMPIGHDLLHTDSPRGETTSGTRVDSVDTRFAKVFDIAVAAVIAGIEDAAQVADVFVPVVYGNHDENSSVLLSKVVKAYFRADPRVTVDDSELGRKYLHWGCNLLCLTHRFTNWATAPNVMATEAPVEWGLTTSREILTGHLHSRKATSYQAYSETHGVVVRVLPSLSATDRWHAENGFVSNLRAAESHLYSEESGIIGSHLSRARS